MFKFNVSSANGVPMKQIQEWLGHSDFGATANIYAHLDSRRNAQWLGLCTELKKKSQQPEKQTTGVISGGVGGIRTHGTVAGTPDFESGPL